ncbi:MAG: hypothetical protein M3Z09_12430 [Acidobacteriota bacterium]|nr:hypothetical protein [Acidobacteriota bacterium]
MLLRLSILLFLMPSLHAQVAKQIRVEYRKGEAGVYTAFLMNSHSAAATAYIAQATYRLESRQQATAWGGDSYSTPLGGTEIPAHAESESNSLPPKGQPLTSGIVAVIYEDGFSEGDEDVVQMLLAGRRRTLTDLNQLVPVLERSLDRPTILTTAANLRAADLAEASKLDELITVPGVKHQYFMTAVPSQLLRDQHPRPAIYREWLERLHASKPPL